MTSGDDRRGAKRRNPDIEVARLLVRRGFVHERVAIEVLKAQKARQLIAEDFRRCFAEVDIIAGPTAPTPAFRLGEKVDDPVQMYLNDIYTIAVNLAGLPGISIPCGYSAGLPVGLQLIGPHFGEGPLLNFAHVYQRETDWHMQLPAGLAGQGAK